MIVEQNPTRHRYVIMLMLFVSVRVYWTPEKKTVYPIYSASARLWWSGGEMYAPARPLTVQGGYRYSPLFAILTVPFALFTDDVGGVLWRTANRRMRSNAFSR